MDERNIKLSNKFLIVIRPLCASKNRSAFLAPNGWRYWRLVGKRFRNANLSKLRQKPKKRGAYQPSSARFVSPLFDLQLPSLSKFDESCATLNKSRK
jgi:hypothetical protein